MSMSTVKRLKMASSCKKSQKESLNCELQGFDPSGINLHRLLVALQGYFLRCLHTDELFD